jgi:hypothetical protein
MKRRMLAGIVLLSCFTLVGIVRATDDCWPGDSNCITEPNCVACHTCCVLDYGDCVLCCYGKYPYPPEQTECINSCMSAELACKTLCWLVFQGYRCPGPIQ